MRKKLMKLVPVFAAILLVLSSCSLLDSTPPEITPKSPEVEYGTTLSISDVADVTDEYEVAEAKFQATDSERVNLCC